MSASTFLGGERRDEPTYARAAARVEQQTGVQAASVAASEPTTPAAASDDAPARGIVEIDAASWASSVRERRNLKHYRTLTPRPYG